MLDKPAARMLMLLKGTASIGSNNPKIDRRQIEIHAHADTASSFHASRSRLLELQPA
jgi:hypothetical protein